MNKPQIELDRFDERIIEILSQHGRISITELAKRIGLSKTPTQIRVQKLEDEGVITGYRAMVDPFKLGIDQVAFVEVRLSDTRETALQKFNQAVREIPEIEEAYMMAAHFDYLLKVRTRNMNDYRVALGHRISNLPYVASTSTFIAMEAVKDEIF